MEFFGKKILYVTGETIPSFNLNGSTLATIGLCLKLKECGANLIAVTYEETVKASPSNIPEELAGYGISLDIIKKDTSVEAGAFGEGYYYESFAALVQVFVPDVIFCYDWSAVAIVSKVPTNALKISLTCDLRHIAIKERAINYFRKNKSFTKKIFNIKKSYFDYSKAIASEVRVLKPFTLNINHAYHHCTWLKNRGANVSYLPQFIRIPGSQFSQEALGGTLRIMLAGNVDGVISIRGLEMLVYKIIPELKRAMGNTFEVNYFGHYNESAFGPALKNALKEAADVFEFKGFRPLKDALMTHHIFMIPNNISLGFRTRIVEGMAYGACMLAHKANTYGMPELKDGENILIASTPAKFVEKILAVYRDPGFLKKIRTGSYNEYVNTYSVDVTFNELVKRIR